MQYLFIFSVFALGEKPKDLYQSYARDITELIQEEMCNFMGQLMYFMHDGNLTSFTNLLYHAHDFAPVK